MANTEAKAKTVTFVTSVVKGTSNLRIILSHGKDIYQQGVRVGVEKPVFANFKNGRYATNNPEYIEKLRGMSSFGKDFYEATDSESETEPQGNVGGEDLSAKTKPQLIAIAKERGLTVKEGMTKPQLLELFK
jgi:hypothetical protein